jgi:hypothetical protein
MNFDPTNALVAVLIGAAILAIVLLRDEWR